MSSSVFVLAASRRGGAFVANWVELLLNPSLCCRQEASLDIFKLKETRNKERAHTSARSRTLAR